jgi:Capsule polysaccharide biosynthesis protein
MLVRLRQGMRKAGRWAGALVRSAGSSMPKRSVLFATSTGAYNHATTCDSALAQALGLRGATVDVLLCDGVIPACQMSKMGRVDAASLATIGQQTFCQSCRRDGLAAFRSAGTAILHPGDRLSEDERRFARRTAEDVPSDAIPRFTWQGLALGEHAYAGALRFFARGDLVGEPHGEPVLRKYLEAAMLTALSTRNLLKGKAFDVVVAHHGIYVPQGIICEVARQMGVRVVTWNPAYRRSTFIFSHDETYHHSMISEPVDLWDQLELSPRQRDELLAYLNSRRHGGQDWIWFHEYPREDVRGILKELGVVPGKPVVVLLTSVVWDAQLHYQSNAFPNMIEWIFQTVDYFARRPDLQLVIRVHPAEVRGFIPSRQMVAEEIKKRYSELPPNIFVVEPQNQASTYALCDLANAILIYNTKTGIEVAAAGHRTIVAGEAWIRGKGIALDASTPDEYFSLLDRLPGLGSLDAKTQERARRYAYHFFFRRTIPFPFIRDDKKLTFALDIKSADDLRPGRYPGLDIVCDGILDAKPFIYPAERLVEGASQFSAATVEK